MNRRRVLFVLAATPMLLGLGIDPVLPPEAAEGFGRVLRRVREERSLGADVRVLGVRIERDSVRMDLQVGESERTVVLRQRGRGEARHQSLYFDLEVDDETWSDRDEVLQTLAAHLDDAFRSSPWRRPLDDRPPEFRIPDPPTRPRWRTFTALFVGLGVGVAGLAAALRRDSLL